MADLHEQIAELEAEIEHLTRAAERCRMIIMAARLVIYAGGLLLATNVIGLIRLEPMMFLVAIIAVLGGIVLFGSNKSTLGRSVAAIRDCEARRTQLIDRLGLHLASDISHDPPRLRDVH